MNKEKFSTHDIYDILDRVGGLVIFGISSIFCIIILYISIQIKLYQHIVNELMIYVLISEILFAISRFFCLSRCLSDEMINNLNPNWTKYLQLFFSIYCNLWTLLSVLFHTIKINDAISNRTQWFAFKSKRIITRLIIFITPLLSSGIFMIINSEYFIKGNHPDKNEKDCNSLYCKYRYPLDWIAYALYIGIILCIFIVIILAHRFLQQKIKQPREMKSAKLIIKMQRLAKKIWIYPITNLCYWLVRIFLQIISEYIDKEYSIKWVSTIFIYFSGLRGVMYSLVFIFTQNALFNATIGRIYPKCVIEDEDKEKEDLFMMEFKKQNENNEFFDELVLY